MTDNKEQWSVLPLHYLKLAGDTRVKALSNARGLKKGEVYYISLVTDKGLIQLIGQPDYLHPMSAFSRPMNGKQELDTVPANDN